MGKPKSYVEWAKERNIRQANNLLNCEKFNKYQQEVMNHYNLYLGRIDVTVATRKTNLQHAKLLLLFFNKKLENVTQEDIDKYINYIQEHYSERTASDKRKFLSLFFRWHFKKKHKEDIPVIADLNTKRKVIPKLPEDLLTPKEIIKLVSVISSPRDKAIVILLYETAARIGEFMQLKIKDVHLGEEDYGFIDIPKGKTKPRRVPIIYSFPYIRKWLNLHPLRGSPDAPLFCNMTNHLNEVLQVDGITRILKKYVRIAGIKKNIYPHLLRHSRLTELGRELKESELKVYAGWNTAAMAQVYVHLSGEDVANKLLANAGLIDVNKSDKNGVLKMIKCPRCDKYNEPDKKLCKCGFALDIKEAKPSLKEQEVKQLILDVLGSLGFDVKKLEKV